MLDSLVGGRLEVEGPDGFRGGSSARAVLDSAPVGEPLVGGRLEAEGADVFRGGVSS